MPNPLENLLANPPVEEVGHNTPSLLFRAQAAERLLQTLHLKSQESPRKVHPSEPIWGEVEEFLSQPESTIS